jgi:hypothetical protein
MGRGEHFVLAFDGFVNCKSWLDLNVSNQFLDCLGIFYFRMHILAQENFAALVHNNLASYSFFLITQSSVNTVVPDLKKGMCPVRLYVFHQFLLFKQARN